MWMPITAIIAAFLIHEGGHYLAARFFGKKLRFWFAWGHFGVPRFVWDKIGRAHV